MLYNYNEKNIKKIIGYYDNENSNDYTLLVYQSKSPTYIKYFTFQNNANIFNIRAYSAIVRLKSNETTEFNVKENLLDTSSYGKIEVETINIYDYLDEKTSEIYGKERTELLLDTTDIIISKESDNSWYEYKFVLIENSEKDFTRLYYLTNVNVSIRVCTYQCGNCTEDYYKCDNCRNDKYTLFKLDEQTEENCYPIDQLLKGYVYNSEENIFQKCYESCDFCSEFSHIPSDHKCLSCTDGYLPSYINEGNCYQKNDVNFITNSCIKYKINSTGECIEESPTTTPYYSFEYNYMNFTEQINDDSKLEHYKKLNIIPPKYLFNNICYDKCPLYSLLNDEDNTCICEFGFHIQDGETICHPGLYCISNNKEYRYFLEDTKECITNGCPSDYYQFNFRCYKMDVQIIQKNQMIIHKNIYKHS